MEEMDAQIVEVNSSTGDSSNSEDEEENETETRAAELEKLVSNNPYLYDVHVELVDLYRKLGDLISMRAAYERFSTAYPLTPTIWLEWIRDEIKIAQSEKEKLKVLDLFKKAVKDYLSVQLWQEYCQYAIGICSLKEVREIFELGTHQVGLHVSEGSLFWDMYREFEMAHLSLANPETDEFSEQLKRVIEIYRRQLAIPLLDMENTMKEFEQFVEQLPNDHGIDIKQIQSDYNKALKLIETYKTFEEDLIRCEDDNKAFDIYMNYIKVINDRVMVICTYERAVARLCLNVELWIAYCLYAPQLGRIALTVSKKAVRNCSWVGELWDLRLKIMEMNDENHEDVLSCFEESLKCVGSDQHLKLWRAYIEYVRRHKNMDVKLDTIFTQAKEQLSFDTEQLTKLLKMQADLKVKTDFDVSRSIWNEIMDIPQNKSSGNLWVCYINLERFFGSTQNVRNLYQKAMKNCPDWAEYFADEWLMHEQESSMPQNVIKCTVITKRILKELEKEKNKNNSYNSKRNIYQTQTSVENENRTFKKPKLNNKSNKKEIIEKPCIKIIQMPTDLDPLTTIFISNITSDITDKKLKSLFPNSLKITIPTDKFGTSRCFAYVEFKNQEETNEALQRDREPIEGRPMFISKYSKDKTERHTVFKYENKREPKKLFVRGLPLSYDKEAVKDIFKEFEPIDVRLVTKFNGKSKGLAYVEFATEEAAKKAIEATDNKEVEGFTISVAVSSPPSKAKPQSFVSGSLSRSSGPANHPKSRLQFLPRCLETKKTAVEEDKVTKSNEDFRKMLNQKS